jgi:cytochrome c1
MRRSMRAGQMKSGRRLVPLAVAALAWAGCGRQGPTGAAAPAAPASAPASAAAAAPALTPWEMEHGVGPVKEPVALAAVDAALAESGLKTFEMKCMVCHKLDERYVGPSLREVTQRRTPEYIMNMILNPLEMIDKHPVAKKLFAEHLVPMTFQNVSEQEVRALVEYLRSVAPTNAPAT